MDDGTTSALYIIGLAGIFILSAFFSVIKIIFSATERGADAADNERLRYYTSKVSATLKNRAAVSSAVVVGKTLCNVAFTALALNYYRFLFPNAGQVEQCLVPIISSFLALTLFAHYIPRAFALRFYRSYVAPSLLIYSVFSWFMMPLSWLFTSIQSGLLSLLKYDEKLAFLSEEDKARIRASDDGAEALNEEEREMIRSIFDLSETTVDEIMVPRINMAAIDVNSDLQTALAVIKEKRHSRIPAYKDTIDQITGILYVKDIIPWLSENKAEDWDLSSVLRKCLYVPMGKKINDLMKEFKVKHLHLAVVVDEYGGTAGIVTMEDILEEIVGDIQDEFDEEDLEVVQVDDNTYLVNPHIDLHDLNGELGINLYDEADYNTLSGLIYHEYGDVPLENTRFEYSGLRITILKMDNQRIEKVKVEVLQSSEKVVTQEPF